MSRNIFTVFNKLNLNFNENNSKINIIILILSTSLHCVYAVSTNKKEKIIIIKKYKMVKNGFTQFMVIDDKNRHFNVNNSLWYWKWDSIEDWNNIKEEDKIRIKYYGWRVPLLGLFPNIYMSSCKNIQNK